MNEQEIRAEIARRKDTFRREQAALPFTEKVRLAFAMSRRRDALKQARIVSPQDAPLPSSSVTKG